MVIHSTLHLLGYDHLDDESEIDMRTREVKVLGELYDK
jgi:ssRNA-specific RNase YbeY (16S rRNA maturation enzyme)